MRWHLSAFQILSTSFLFLILSRLEKLLIIISCFLASDYVCNCAYPTSIKKENGNQLIEIYKDIALYKYILHVSYIVLYNWNSLDLNGIYIALKITYLILCHNEISLSSGFI